MFSPSDEPPRPSPAWTRNQCAQPTLINRVFIIKGAQAMGGIIYLVGLIVIVLFILSLLGLR